MFEHRPQFEYKSETVIESPSHTPHMPSKDRAQPRGQGICSEIWRGRGRELRGRKMGEEKEVFVGYL
jgi:hypothetical protein